MSDRLRDLFYAARGQHHASGPTPINRSDLEARIDAHPDPPAHFDTSRIRWVECGTGTPDGRLLRHMIAALPGEGRLPGVNFFEALRVAGTGYWPPVSPLSREEILTAFDDMGITVEKSHGRRVMITLPEEGNR